MPIRNPFRRAPGSVDVQQENRPIARGGVESGFQNAKTTGTSPVDVKDANYQLCEINDSGVFLPVRTHSPLRAASQAGSR